MNSRISYHGGWGGTATPQMLGDVLAAAARAPLTGAYLTIYAATSENVYVYDPATHDLVLHVAGDWRSDATAVFEVGLSADHTLDAGAAMHLAQLESIALWTGTASQLASCPRATAATYANSHWNPVEPVDIAISFGKRTVPGLTTTLVAISSDGSLPDPLTDGATFLDDALARPAYDSTFATGDLTAAEMSQLLWAAYGCSNHRASGGKAGLVCSSAVANYYLTRRIYAIGPEGVFRYHNRQPPGTDQTTRDHRLESVTAGDVRPALREAAGLPDAPRHLVICVGATGAWPELEVGFAAMGAQLQAAALDLQGHWRVDFSAEEQAAIRQATGIPSGDLPMAIVSLGHPLPGATVEMPGEREEAGWLSVENRITAGTGVTIHYATPDGAPMGLAIYDCQGREVVRLVERRQGAGAHTAWWDCRDDRGRPVLSGVYLCRLKAGAVARTAHVVVVR